MNFFSSLLTCSPCSLSLIFDEKTLVNNSACMLVLKSHVPLKRWALRFPKVDGNRHGSSECLRAHTLRSGYAIRPNVVFVAKQQSLLCACMNMGRRLVPLLGFNVSRIFGSKYG